jgi:hypothetical protein
MSTLERRPVTGTVVHSIAAGAVHRHDPAELASLLADAVLDRLVAGRARPTSGAELSAAVVAAIIRRLLRHLEELTAEAWELERKVTGGHLGDAEGFLEQMFRVRHGLLSLATMATLDHEVYARASRTGSDRAADIVDQLAG